MRKSKISRETKETNINLELNIDGKGELRGEIGIGFFDHMLNSLIKMSNFDLNIDAKGDMKVDNHHIIEDIGIVLGMAIKESLGDKKNIERISSMYMPMDEALILSAIDISGRPYIVFDCDLPFGKVGDMETELVEEFLKSLVLNAGINLHIKLIHGKNIHHIIEAIFKAVGRTIYKATRRNTEIVGVLSTKGMI